MLSRDQLGRAAAEAGYPLESFEKVAVLLHVLRGIRAHPFLGSRLALKGGTALNLFVFDLPRLSVDIDLNYVGGANRATMPAANYSAVEGSECAEGLSAPADRSRPSCTEPCRPRAAT